MGRVVTTSTLALVAGALLLPLAGCRTPVDEHWGESFAELKQQQIQNPDAAFERPADPNAGIDGATAQGALEEYRKPPEAKRERRGMVPTLIDMGFGD